MAAERIARTGLTRDNNLMYFIKGGDVWAVPRKRAGKPKGRPAVVKRLGIDLDYSRYLYYLDAGLNVVRSKRK